MATAPTGMIENPAWRPLDSYDSIAQGMAMQQANPQYIPGTSPTPTPSTNGGYTPQTMTPTIWQPAPSASPSSLPVSNAAAPTFSSPYQPYGSGTTTTRPMQLNLPNVDGSYGQGTGNSPPGGYWGLPSSYKPGSVNSANTPGYTSPITPTPAPTSNTSMPLGKIPAFGSSSGVQQTQSSPAPSQMQPQMQQGYGNPPPFGGSQGYGNFPGYGQATPNTNLSDLFYLSHGASGANPNGASSQQGYGQNGLAAILAGLAGQQFNPGQSQQQQQQQPQWSQNFGNPYAGMQSQQSGPPQIGEAGFKPWQRGVNGSGGFAQMMNNFGGGYMGGYGGYGNGAGGYGGGGYSSPSIFGQSGAQQDPMAIIRKLLTGGAF